MSSEQPGAPAPARCPRCGRIREMAALMAGPALISRCGDAFHGVAAPAAEPRRAEHLLASEGVFAGHHGLRGLLTAADFWQRQEYGTRLYYGDGGLDYLHRDVLSAAVKALDKAAALEAELAQARADHAETLAAMKQERARRFDSERNFT